MPMLPEFRLETYFSEWEFAARYHLTASDAQTISLPEFLELADENGRTDGSLSSSATQKPTDFPPFERPSRAPTTTSLQRRSCVSQQPRKPSAWPCRCC